MAGIQDWDRVTLPIAAGQASVSAAELAGGVGIDQFDERMARAWINDALGRGLIRRTPPADGSPRYAITPKGRSRLG